MKKQKSSDSVERIRAKRRQIEAFICEFDSYEADCEGSYIDPSLALSRGEDYNNEEFRTYLQLKLQLLVFYSTAKELGVGKKVLNHILDSVEVCLRGDAEDSCEECFSLGFEVAPFWNIDSMPGLFIYSEDSRCEPDGDSGEDSVSGFLDDSVMDAYVEFIHTFPVEVEDSELEFVLKHDERFVSMAMEEELFYDETVSYVYGVYSQLLSYYTVFVNTMDAAERRAFLSCEPAKKIEDMLFGPGKFSPGKSLSGGVHILPELFLYCMYELNDGYRITSNFSQLYADFCVGLRANLLDLLIFELDEKYHFLPEIYAGRSDEILPDFKGESEMLKSWMVKKAV